MIAARFLASLVLAAVFIVVGVVAVLWLVVSLTAGTARGWRLAIAFDQLANTLAGGSEDETISSRAWRLRHATPWRLLRPAIDAVAALLGDVDHCRSSHQSEVTRAVSYLRVK